MAVLITPFLRGKSSTRLLLRSPGVRTETETSSSRLGGEVNLSIIGPDHPSFNYLLRNELKRDIISKTYYMKFFKKKKKTGPRY